MGYGFLIDATGQRCCAFCAVPFQPVKPWQRFCSKKHQQQWAWWEWGWNYRYKTDINLWELLESQNLTCRLCGEDLSSGWHIDHIIPIAVGGTTTRDNIQALCGTCNHGKYMLSAGEYIEHCRRVVKWSEDHGQDA